MFQIVLFAGYFVRCLSSIFSKKSPAIYLGIFILVSANQAFALSDEQSKHLLLRAGFAAEPALMAKLKSLNKAQSIDLLINLKPEAAVPPACAAKSLPSRKVRKSLSREERKALQKEQRGCINTLKTWYIEQLVRDDAILSHQMTLFWHNLFTSSFRKVKSVNLIYKQHMTLQKHALGNFSEILKAVVTDPAMLIYLDNVSNTKKRPNENLARELLELFTLGEGNYNEQDVLSAAKALTGLGIDGETYQLSFRAKRHDSSVKEIFNGIKINDANQLLDAILSQPHSAKFITEKVWLHFVSKVDEQQVSLIAKEFSVHWNIKRLVKKILLSNAFWQDQGQMFKSPVELVVGSAKMFGAVKITAQRMQRMARQMGQDLFNPPNVKGWPVGSAWVDTNKLIIRQQFSSQLARALRSDMQALSEQVCSKSFLNSLSTLPLPAHKSMNMMDQGACAEQLTQIITNPIWQLK